MLVIESCPEVAEIIGEQLELAGYRALVQVGARAGIEAMQQHPGGVALVLLDVPLPHFSYLAVAEKIWSLQPQIPIVLCCGGALPSLRSTVPGQRFAGVLQKPFRMAELVGLLCELGVERAQG